MSLWSAQTAGQAGPNRITQCVFSTFAWLDFTGHVTSNDLEMHIQDLLGVIKCEDLQDIALIGHSYGGMVATGVADRARDRIAQLIYLDAFVPQDGQTCLDLIGPEPRRRRLESAKAGDGWRIPHNPQRPTHLKQI